MEELLKYLENNGIIYSNVDDITLEIANKTYQLITPDEDGKLIDNDMELCAEETDADFYIYSFGKKWYFRDTDDIDIQFNEVKYLGESTFQKDLCDVFLGVHEGFELLNGSRTVKDWVKKAKFLGVKHLGICDRGTLAAVLKFQKECLNNDIHPIIGETFLVANSDKSYNYELKVFVKDEIGWENLLGLNNILNVEKRDVTETDLNTHSDGLVFIFDPKSTDYEKVPFDDFYYQLDTVEYEDADKDLEYLNNLRKFVRGKKGRPVFMCDAYYLDKEHSHIKKLLNDIADKSQKVCLNQYFKCFEEYFEELKLLFKEDDIIYDILAEIIDNTMNIAEICQYSVKTNNRYLPRYPMTKEESSLYVDNEDMFWSLIEKGLLEKVSEDKLGEYVERVKREADVISKGGFIDYFLTLYDITSFARSKGILTGYGRGSAAGCEISFLMNLLYTNAMDFDLLFERFLNAGRVGKWVDNENIIVDTEEGPQEYWPDDRLKIERDNKFICIDAKDLQEGDEIIKKF